MIKWIPRAARQHCATLLTKIILGIVNKPSGVEEWMKLFIYGRHILHRPARGGARRNITNIITRRCSDFMTDPMKVEEPPSRSARVFKKHKNNNEDDKGMTSLARAVTVRLEEGNFKAAVRLLASDDTMAADCSETLQALQEKHPSTPSDRLPIPPTDPSCIQIVFDEPTVRKALLSFPPGSSSGCDGLTPQHIKDMITAEGQSSHLLTAITTIINLIVAGNVPDTIKPFFFGGRLIALSKKDGGIRPIVVGQTFRRLASKLVNSYATGKLSASFAPLQLGVGVSGGVEAAVHAARRFVEHLSYDIAVAKLDFRNAFNTIRRDAMLRAVASSLPEAYSYIHASYATSSNLAYGKHTIESAEGVQQGDPLGPLLFCLTIQPLLSDCRSELRIGYLDDITLGGEIQILGDEVEKLRAGAGELGLALNEGKCEIITTMSTVSSLPNNFSQFNIVSAEDATLLGSPLLDGAAMDKVLGKHIANLKTASSRLSFLQSHDALVILKHSLSLPKLLYNLRSSFCGNHPSLLEFDSLLRECLSHILNVSMDDNQWIQASLPVKSGGLGIRRAHQIAPSAYLASASGANSLVSSILPFRLHGFTDPHIDQALDAWKMLGGSVPPSGESSSSQRPWDQDIVTMVTDQLLATAPDDYTRARLLAISSPHAGDWLNAPPITAIGLRMTNEAIRVATGLRLGANLCMPHNCQCGSVVDARGSHGLSCKRSAGRQQRHSLINDIVYRGLGRAHVAATKEPTGLITGSNLRPDGSTLIPWTRGKCLAWDATTPDTLAMSHLSSTSTQAGAAAAQASMLKDQKYSALTPTFHFVGIAVETLGPWNPEGLAFIRELGRRTSQVTGDQRETAYLLQRISVAVQLGNVASIIGSLPNTPAGDQLDSDI